MKNRAFFSGAVLLVIFNLIGKIIGSVYRISLAGILGGTGMGQYQLVFPLYCLILTISTSGIPIAISKIVSENSTQGKVKDSKKILKIGILILLGLSIFGASMIVLLAKIISNFQGNSQAFFCYYGIAPAVVFVGILSALRGYFQGNLKMFPTAISGLIEQVVKLCLGLFFARELFKFGTEFAVLGALIGISISEFVAMLFLIVCYFFWGREDFKASTLSENSNKFLFKSLVSVATPITIGGLISPLTSMIDSFLVVNLLMFSGLSGERATTLLGLQAGVVEPLVNIPVTIAISIAVVLLPNISRLNARAEKDKVKNLIFKSVQITMSIAICAMICYIIFGEQALNLLYGRKFAPSELFVATKLLFLASINIIFLALVQISASALQGLGESKYAVKSLLFGSVLKIVFEVILLLSPIGIYGTVISGGICYLLVFYLNLRKLKKETGICISKAYFYVSLQASVVCLFAYFGKILCAIFFSPTISFLISAGVTVLIFALSYYLFFISTKAIAFRERQVK